jgi:hypothetical protein
VGIGRLLRLADFLAGTWSPASSYRLARRGFGRPSHLANFARQMGRKEVMGLTLGTPFLGTDSR